LELLLRFLAAADSGFTMNFSLRTLLIFMAAAAVVSASLVSAAPIIGDLFYTVGLMTIPFVGVAALYLRGPQRAACIGFLLVFTSYFFHTLWPSEIRATWAVAQRAGNIDYPTQNPITTRMLSVLFEGVHGAFQANVRSSPRSAGIYESAAKFVAFQTVGHVTIGTLLGLVGGALARRFALRLAPTIMDAERKTL
jgi:hypothetical protein